MPNTPYGQWERLLSPPAFAPIGDRARIGPYTLWSHGGVCTASSATNQSSYVMFRLDTLPKHAVLADSLYAVLSFLLQINVRGGSNAVCTWYAKSVWHWVVLQECKSRNSAAVYCTFIGTCSLVRLKRIMPRISTSLEKDKWKSIPPLKRRPFSLGERILNRGKSYLLTSRTDPYSYYSQILKVAFSLCMTENVFLGATVAAYGSTLATL